MQHPSPMRRLLQGDVGSGKTIVALQAAIIAIENGYQVALHGAHGNPGHAALSFRAAHRWKTPAIASCCSPARWKRTARSSARRHIAHGDAHLVIGTHALIQENVEFDNLASSSSTSSTASA